MGRRSDDSPGWRTAAAALAAFAVGAQLVLSGLVLGAQTLPGAQLELSVICVHDAATGDPTAPGHPAPAKSHEFCPACACAHSSKLVLAPPASPRLGVLHGRSEAMPVRWIAARSEHRLPSPYASRAPPCFA